MKKRHTAYANLACLLLLSQSAALLANVTLSFSRFTAGQTFQFSIDVDDQLTRSELGQIRVANSEMQGALVQLEVVSEKGQRMNLTVEFDGSSRFEVIADDC